MTLEEINELEIYFKGIGEQPIDMDDCTKIINPKRFIESHILITRANINNEKFEPYFKRLVEFKKYYNGTSDKRRNNP